MSLNFSESPMKKSTMCVCLLGHSGGWVEGASGACLCVSNFEVCRSDGALVGWGEGTAHGRGSATGRE